MKTNKTKQSRPLSPFGGRGASRGACRGACTLLLIACFAIQAKAQVNLSVNGGVAFTVPSAEPATPGATYRWLENGSVIPSASGVTYTTTKNTAGTYMYIRQAKTADCDWLTSNPYIVAVNCGATRSSAAATENQTVCYNSSIINITYSTVGVSSLSNVAVDNLPPGITYAWSNNTLTISGSPTAAGAFTYTVRVCGVAAATGIITVHPAFTAGAITSGSATTVQGTNPNVTIANATPAAGGNNSITYQWRRSGTSSATLTGGNTTYALNNTNQNYNTAGIYYFNRYAKDGACNTAFTASNGQYVLTVTYPPPSDCCTCGSLTWSYALRHPVMECMAVSALSLEIPPPAQYRVGASNVGYYYNGMCIRESFQSLCPYPWRLPTIDEANMIQGCWTLSSVLTSWGHSGYAVGETIKTDGGSASHVVSTITAWDVKYMTTWRLYGGGGTPYVEVKLDIWSNGNTVHCVRDGT